MYQSDAEFQFHLSSHTFFSDLKPWRYLLDWRPFKQPNSRVKRPNSSRLLQKLKHLKLNVMISSNSFIHWTRSFLPCETQSSDCFYLPPHLLHHILYLLCLQHYAEDYFPHDLATRSTLFCPHPDYDGSVLALQDKSMGEIHITKNWPSLVQDKLHGRSSNVQTTQVLFRKMEDMH